MRALVPALLTLTGLLAGAAAWGEQEETAAAAASQSPPKEARKAFDAAAKAAKDKRTDDARRGYEKAVELYPGYAEAWCELGKLQMGQKQPDAARKSFESAIKANPNYVTPYLELSAQEYASQNWQALADSTGRLIQLRPADYPRIYQLNAIASINLRNLEAAEKSAREAQRLDPRHKFPATWHVLGVILATRGDFAGAAEQLREYLGFTPADPDNGATRRMLAELERRAGPLPPPGAATFRAESNLALVRFQVSPQKGKLISDLRAEDIEILEDGVPRKTALFEGGRFYPRTVPLEITLLFDCSGSVQQAGTLDPHVFHQSLLDEYVNARIAIYAFADRLTRLTTPTRDGAALMKAMNGVSIIPSGGTPLFGSIAETARDVAASGGNAVRMLVIFSDGESTARGDDIRDEEAIQAALDRGIALYPVTLSNSLAGAAPVRSTAPPDPAGAVYSNWPMRRAASINKFEQLAAATGGMKFEAISNADVLPAILKKMARHIQYDYVAGFYPPSSGGTARHKVEVVLRAKDRGRILGGTRTVVH